MLLGFEWLQMLQDFEEQKKKKKKESTLPQRGERYRCGVADENDANI
jgi:hypothetical protein